MQLQSTWKTIRWSRIALIFIPIALLLAAPLWYRLINPAAYAEVRCVIQEFDGTVTKGAGQSECLNNGKQTLVLRVGQNQELVAPSL
jgi:hypothetical protein